MKNARQISDISILAEENLADIFSRFSVKTLLQLKCVCKRWHTLISTPWFISTHLKRFSSGPDAHYMLALANGYVLIPTRNPGSRIDIKEPIRAYSIVGSINGLVCLVTDGFHKLIYLWNPSINQFKKLLMNLQQTRKCYASVGFGYEKDSDDYKVMRIVSYYGGGSAPIVEVYSTKLESWKEVNTDVRLNRISTPYCSVIVEGFTYWVIRNFDNGKTVVASFDLRSEMFSFIPVPEVLETESHNFMNYNGSIALLRVSSHGEFKKYLEVWMIQGSSCGEGVWEKKFTFDMGFHISTQFWGLTSEDLVVRNDPNMSFLFNLRTKQLRIIGTPCLYSVCYYTESLVSIKGFKIVPNLKERRKPSIPQKKEQDRANKHIAERHTLAKCPSFQSYSKGSRWLKSKRQFLSVGAAVIACIN